MNEYRYSEIEIGHKEAFSAVIDKKKMELFLAMTQDSNPLHNDQDFALLGGVSRKSRIRFFSGLFLFNAGRGVPAREMVPNI